MSLPVECALHLRHVTRQMEFWRMAAAELPTWLARTLETARDYAARAPEHAEAARRFLSALKEFDAATESGDRPSASDVHALWPSLEASYAVFAAAPDREDPRGLAMARHSLVNVLAPLRLASAEELSDKLRGALAALPEGEEPALRSALRRCLEWLSEDVTSEAVHFIEATLEPWRDDVRDALRAIAPRLSNPSGLSSPLRAVLIIEDQWWGDALEQKVRALLPSHVVVRRMRTLQAANAALKAMVGDTPGGEGDVLSKGSGREASAHSDLLVFLDLGLPEDDAALHEGRVSRAHGKRLLTRLRDYQVNARTIVLTSPSEYLPDHAWIAGLGVAPEDFILKTEREWDREVDEALRRAWERGRVVHQVELDEANGLAFFDGIEVKLAPLDFKIASVLCESLSDKPQARRRRRAFSCAEIADLLDLYFGEEPAPESVPTHIHTIRRAIHDHFNEAARPVDAHRVVVTEFYGDEVRYRLSAGQFLHKGQVKAPVTSSVSLLVVEDNEAWQKAIATPLREAGYEVEVAFDVDAAVRAAESSSPTVLCVDMHLPLSANASDSEDEGGLRVIERVRAIDPEARIVVLTDLAQHDNLRVEAARRRVWIHDYIHKADPLWLWKLHRSVWRLTREWQQGIDFSQDALQTGHVVELSRSNPRDFWVDGISIPLSKVRAKLVHALAARVEERISSYELQALVYEDEGGQDRSNALIQTIKHMRKQIEDETKEAGRTVNAKHIIAEESGGYILCGPVLYRN